MATQTITIASKQYEDEDDCLAAAESDAQDLYDLAGWDLCPTWADDDRTEIELTLPACADHEHEGGS